MTKNFDLSNFSDEELTSLIDEATTLRDAKRQSRDRKSTDADGSKGQDMSDPDHGVISTPTPRKVRRFHQCQEIGQLAFSSRNAPGAYRTP